MCESWQKYSFSFFKKNFLTFDEFIDIPGAGWRVFFLFFWQAEYGLWAAIAALGLLNLPDVSPVFF